MKSRKTGMDIAVIVSTYNMASYLERCIESVVGQTDGRFELIVINDGSTDNTGSVCEKWVKKDSRIKYVSKKNEGLGISRNLGLRMTEADYVTFLDADDQLDEHYVEYMKQAVEDKNSDIVICDMFFEEKAVEQPKENVSAVRLPNGEINIFKEKYLLSKSRTFMCGKLFRRRLFIDYAVKMPEHTFEDIATVPFLVAKAQRIYHVSKPLYHYLRNREGSIINRFNELKNTRISLDEVIEKFKKDGSFERNEEELKYLYWGQVCHVWKVTSGKFSAANSMEINDLREDIIRGFQCNFPKAGQLWKYRYYVDDNARLQEAVKHLTIRNEQIVNNPFEADYVVLSGRIEKKEEKQITVDVTKTKYMRNAESLSWEMSDEIFSLIN